MTLRICLHFGCQCSSLVLLCFAFVTLVIYAEVLFASFGRATSPTAAHAKGATLKNLELPFGQSAGMQACLQEQIHDKYVCVI